MDERIIREFLREHRAPSGVLELEPGERRRINGITYILDADKRDERELIIRYVVKHPEHIETEDEWELESNIMQFVGGWARNRNCENGSEYYAVGCFEY